MEAEPAKYPPTAPMMPVPAAAPARAVLLTALIASLRDNFSLNMTSLPILYLIYKFFSRVNFDLGFW
jgi:hypothetical protein